ncbi:FtsX-like permease family protein [Duganella sp. FT80W]|uniref:FtsX-like permease family protein n=1 Tax=Duganella guangzhouensis TaxID=2666084 RepID=A0A6I2L779_9BURK|nr:ABC transporter permease [Duganella guangzhouensis]MRW93077.1 FtsX-like permease family protein [Duganella guangzhouensis]
MDLRIVWRTLVQEPAYTLTAILSLAIGLAASLLLLAFVRYSAEYDAHVPEADNVYVIRHRFNVDPKSPLYDLAPMFLREAASKLPGVTDATLYIPAREEMLPVAVRVDRNIMRVRALTVLPNFASLLGIHALHGDLQAALTKPDNIVLTEAAALRFFGTTDVVGRVLHAEGKPQQVGAVVPTPPSNTTIPFEILFSVNSEFSAEVRREMLTGESGWMGKQLLRVRPGTSIPALTDALQQVVDRAPSMQHFAPEVMARLGQRKTVEIVLEPLRGAYFSPQLQNNPIALTGDRGNPLLVGALALLAMLILALAAINYVNLTTVRVLRRQRELAMRKVLGAGVPQIVLQFVLESLLVALLATTLGLLLAWLALPIFSQLVGRQLEQVFSPANLTAAYGIGVLLGVTTAIYPAMVALRVHPVQALATRPGTESTGSMRLRRALTVVQVAVAMGLVGVSIAIACQTRYAMTSSPGFDPAPLLIVEMPERVRDSVNARGLYAALAAQPGVAGVAISEDPVGRLDWSWTRDLQRPGGQSAQMDMKSVSTNFFEQLRVKPVAGRLFQHGVDQEDNKIPVVINALAARALGFATPEAAVGETVLFTGFDNKTIRKTIIGIAPELRFRSLREAPQATAYELWTAGGALTVRVEGSMVDIEQKVRELWPRYFPESLLRMRHADEVLAVNYAEDERLAGLLAASAGVALLISAFGTYALCATTVQRRAREIVLRKLHGARSGDVGLLILRETGVLTLSAALISLPPAAIAIQRYLSGYVEHAPIGYWTLALALLLTLAIALLAATRHTWSAMRLSPAEALRA